MQTEPKPIVWAVNDAAIVPDRDGSGDFQIYRVIAVTDEGLPVIQRHSSSMRIGDDGWRRVGVYHRNWFGQYSFRDKSRV